VNCAEKRIKHNAKQCNKRMQILRTVAKCLDSELVSEIVTVVQRLYYSAKGGLHFKNETSHGSTT